MATKHQSATKGTNQLKDEEHKDAPKEVNRPEDTGKSVATTTSTRPARRGSELPAELQSIEDIVMADAGLGTSSASEDNIIPLVSVLNSMSPAAMADNPAYIPGAAPGDILMKGLPVPVVDGKIGIRVQPVWFGRAWVEWIPTSRGGGYVGQHQDIPEDAYEREFPAEDPNDPPKMRWFRKGNGNELIDTRYHGVLVDGVPFIIPFKSTGHTISRGWMSLMNSFKLKNGKSRPAWCNYYRLTTQVFNRKNYSWYNWHVEWDGAIETADEYYEGQALNKALASGEKVVDAAGDEAPTSGTESARTRTTEDLSGLGDEPF